MAEFRNREEYEQWKARRDEEMRARSRELAPRPDSGEPPPDDAPSAGGQSQIPPDGPFGELAEIDQLLNVSWMIYRRRAGALIGLSVFSFFLALFVFVFMVGVAYLISLFRESAQIPLLVGGATTGALGSIIVFCWGQAAGVLAVTDESRGFLDALGEGWRRLWDFIWLYSAAGFIILGGFMLFVVPGVLLLVWFGFSQFLLAEGKEKGMRSLLASKEYVRGIWGQVFLRLLVIWLISAGVGSVPFIGSIISILAMPFMTIYVYLTYESAKMTKGKIAFDDSSGEKAKWIGIGVAGHLVPLLVLALLWHVFQGLCPLLTQAFSQPPF